MLTQSALPPVGSGGPRTAREPREISPSEKKSPPRRILVVDDEALVRWSVAETLGARGYEVIQAEDGKSALRALVDPPGATDVVLLDLRLPDSSDLRILEAMRGLAPRVPVILMTAYSTQDVIDEALRLGAFSVVAKPFDMTDLAPLVSRALASRPS